MQGEEDILCIDRRILKASVFCGNIFFGILNFQL